MDGAPSSLISVLSSDFALSSTKFNSCQSEPNMADEACEIDNALAQLNNDTSDNMDENSISNECSPDKGHTLPILKKILDLSTQVQNLKKQHVALSDQVKLTTESFPGLDVLKSVQLLGADYEVLKRKYLEESSERRRLYNEVIELKGNIRVFCRCRPLNENEIANGSAVSVVNFESSPDELQVNCSDSSKKQFKFDYVFRPEDKQEAVFEQTKPIVTSVLDGFNVCIFAYGQTGTGKTFTMEGTPEHRGVNYRTLEELFHVSEERHGIVKYELLVSMLEVYNEKIRDLLVENSAEPAKKLEVKQTADGTQEVPGLVEARVYRTEDVWEKLKSGNRARSVGSTSANELSSLTVLGENLINGQKTRSHLWLVDLAGSERVGKTEAEGERLKESQFINKSLSALGDVISALASKSAHIPYRNSKLTHILQSSLGGDCKTLMFVQISPSAADLTETLCSLNFATRVRGIESGPARKQTDLTELYKYKQMAEKLKHDEKETRKLQDNLQTMQMRLATREIMCRSLQEKVRDLENQIAEERKIRLKQESRSLAAVSAQPSTMTESTINHTAAQKAMKKPPLNPSKRLPLRRITNFLPPPPERRPSCSSSIDAKENIARTSSMTINIQDLMKPRRRVSIAARPPATPMEPSTTQTLLKPRRRVSVATLCPVTSSDMTTPLRSPTQQSLIRNQRKARYSKLFSALPETRRSVSVETTSPTLMKSNSMCGSPRYPTVVALQRKPLVWTPLKQKSQKISSTRKSLISKMVPRTPPKQNKMLAALNPILIRETLNKVDQCMVRLQQLQYTVAGGRKVVSGVSLSPRSTKGYLRTSLRCKQESARSKHDAARRCPPGKFPRPTNSEGEEWRQMSLPAMLVGETVGEILQASHFAREIVSAVGRKTTTKDPKTPLSQWSNHKVDPKHTQLNDKRKKEKQIKPRSDTPPLQRARSRINFKVSPPKVRESDKENNNKYLANKASLKNGPCASNSSSKTDLVPNPLFLSTHSSRQQQFCKIKSPVISRNIGTQQHRFFIKSPPSAASKFQVKVKNPSIVSISSSPTRPTSLSLSKKSSPEKCVRLFSPSRVVTRLLASPLKNKKRDGVVNSKKVSPKRSVASKSRRSFYPSRLATRLVSPLKSKKRTQIVNGAKQRPTSLLVPAIF
ncbi:Kinesin-like protein KIN-14S, partial [Mucuna pruriens]